MGEDYNTLVPSSLTVPASQDCLSVTNVTEINSSPRLPEDIQHGQVNGVCIYEESCCGCIITTTLFVRHVLVVGCVVVMGKEVVWWY